MTIRRLFLNFPMNPKMRNDCLFTYTTSPFASIVYPILRSKMVLPGLKQLICFSAGAL